MRELLGESEFGLIVENDDKALYQGLKDMLLDAELRSTYAQKAAGRGRNFSAKKLTKATEDYFKELAGK